MKLNQVTVQAILIETQKQVEEAFLKKKEWGQHPYSLSLDLVNTTISNLLLQGILVSSEEQNIYHVDKIQLALIITQLQDLSLQRPPGSYHNIILLSVLPSPVAAKL